MPYDLVESSALITVLFTEPGGERCVISAVNAREMTTVLCLSHGMPLPFCSADCPSARTTANVVCAAKGRAPPQAQYEISVEPPSALRLVRSARGKAP
jgi:hypothetical protein